MFHTSFIFSEKGMPTKKKIIRIFSFAKSFVFRHF